jgi:heterodisulfide reductase subunit C
MMQNYYQELEKDIRFQEGLRACINCGTCTAICSAASFYDYDPKKIVTLVQSANNTVIEDLLKSETIWYCGECMSCKTRCPRGNTPGLVIMALRQLSINTGLFVESEKGRQILALKRAIGGNILKYGYCLHIDTIDPELHPEAGPIWRWVKKNVEKLFNRLGGNYHKYGPGALRKIPESDLEEIQRIFDITGATERFENIEKYSSMQASKMGYKTEATSLDPYFMMVFKYNSNKHYKKQV